MISSSSKSRARTSVGTFSRRQPAAHPRPSFLFQPGLHLLLGLLFVALPGVQQAQKASPSPVHAAATVSSQPRCVTSGARTISISCDYTPMAPDSGQIAGQPQIALNHAELAFNTKDDNWMRLVLRFTKLDNQPFAESRMVYIAIDDDRGNNFVRRPLPAVNLAGLAPGQSIQFEQRLLFPAFQPGHYQVKLWIPSNDPALKFKAAHNWLVSSYGVPDSQSGLNTIASFSVSIAR